MKQNKLRTLYEKDMTKKILASLLSILIGLVVGSVIIAAVGFSNPELGASSVWDGIRIVFAGLFSTGRTAAGVLTWGFNSTNFGNMLFRATPLIMTGLSVAVAFKTSNFTVSIHFPHSIYNLFSGFTQDLFQWGNPAVQACKHLPPTDFCTQSHEKRRFRTSCASIVRSGTPAASIVTSPMTGPSSPFPYSYSGSLDVQVP